MARVLEENLSEEAVSPQIFLTDVCAKALDAIRDNLTRDGNLSRPERVTLTELEWGNHGVAWASEAANSFDLIIASDVVYLPECVDPLIESVKHFIKPNTGRCLLVNNLVRTEAFLGQIEDKIASLGLTLAYEPDIIEDPQDKAKKFKVSLIHEISQ